MNGRQKRYFCHFLFGLELSRPHHAEGVYIINAKHCISSTRSVVYHQAAGRYTLARDEIQGRPAALDDIHDCIVMICQACGLDKKFDKSKLVEFLAYPIGFEPTASRVGVSRAIQLCHG